MAALTIYIANSVSDTIAEVISEYAETKGDSAGKETRKMFRAALDKVIASPWGYATTLYCPANYRRVNVKPFQIFYRINEEKQELTFYSIRGGRQRPLTAATHRNYASAAEKDRKKL